MLIFPDMVEKGLLAMSHIVSVSGNPQVREPVGPSAIERILWIVLCVDPLSHNV